MRISILIHRIIAEWIDSNNTPIALSEKQSIEHEEPLALITGWLANY